MDLLLKSIQDKLGAEVPELKYIDENWGQLDLYGPEIPVKWPCSLITLTSANYSNLGTDPQAKPMNRQEGIVSVEITFAKLKLTNTSFNAPALQKNKAWEIWEIVRKSHAVLHGFNPAVNSGKLIRTGMNSVRRDDGVQEIRVVYSLGLHNC